MPDIRPTVGLFNEYIMFVDQDVDLNDEVFNWYHNKLILIASYAYYNKTHITCFHSFEWENEDPEDETIAAFGEFPRVIENSDILYCKINVFKTIACLQVVLLNNDDLDRLMKIGREAFSEYIYPENGDNPHYLSKRHS